MSDKMRWRYGDTNPVVAAVDSATAIEIGDLLDHRKGRAIPRNEPVWSDNFLGVAMERSRNGETLPIRVATTGVFAYACPSGTFELGDLIAAHRQQEVVQTNDITRAIARVARREEEPTTSVYVDIRSQVMGYSL